MLLLEKVLQKKVQEFIFQYIFRKFCILVAMVTNQIKQSQQKGHVW